jgi:hypothetical protein
MLGNNLNFMINRYYIYISILLITTDIITIGFNSIHFQLLLLCVVLKQFLKVGAVDWLCTTISKSNVNLLTNQMRLSR